MDPKEALAIVIDMATRYGENAEEALPRRLEATDTDDAIRAMFAGQENDAEELNEAFEIRNLWRAIEVVSCE